MSKSKVNTFLNCPWNFYLTYIEDMRSQNQAPEEGSPLKKGLDLHKVFEDYYTLPSAKTVKEPYEDNIFDILKMFPLANKKDPELDAEYDMHLGNFAAWNASDIRNKGIENYIPLYRELKLYNKEYNFVGIIDRAEKKSDGTYRILDYKTGRSHPLKGYLIELGFYKFLFEEEMGLPVTEVGIYFSKDGRLRTTDIGKKDVERSLTQLDTIRSLIKQKKFPKKVGFLCNWCDNKDVCDLIEMDDYLF
jgi:RecB family exonuclease